MGSLKQYAKKRSDYCYVDPRILAIREGWNVRDTTSDRYKAHIKDLVESIAELGVVEPIKGEWDSTENKFYITNGHCRYDAIQVLLNRGDDLESVPVIPNDRDKSPESKLLTMLTSNSGLELTPLEKAEVFKRLHNKGWTVVDIAKKGNCSLASVYNGLILSSAPAELIEMIKTGMVSSSTAVTLIRDHDPETALEIVQEIVEEDKQNGGNGKVTDKKLGKRAKKGGISAVKVVRQVLETCKPTQIDYEDGAIVNVDIPLELWNQLKSLAKKGKLEEEITEQTEQQPEIEGEVDVVKTEAETEKQLASVS